MRGRGSLDAVVRAGDGGALKSGDVMIVASTAAFQAVPFIAAYAATKAFDLIFAEGIAEELRPFGIYVCALCPVQLIRSFSRLPGSLTVCSASRKTAEKVARVGLEGLAAGKTLVISGGKNRLMIRIGTACATRRFIAKMAAKMMRPGTS